MTMPKATSHSSAPPLSTARPWTMSSPTSSETISASRLARNERIDVRSDQHPHRIFDVSLEGAEQLCAQRPVDGTVIGGERHRHHVGDDDRALLDHRPLLAGAD